VSAKPPQRRPAQHRAHAVLHADPVMRALIAAAGPYRLRSEPADSPFRALIHSIAHQQLHGTAARRILERFVALYTPEPFPSPGAVLATPEPTLRAVGFSFAKIRALRDLAEKTLSGIVPPSAHLHELPDDEVIERLTQVRGIGPWTVHMMLMFQLGRPDVLPVDDFGIRNGFRLAYGLKGMPTPRALAQFAERWRPYRTMASWYLWRAVELHRIERLPLASQPPRIAVQKPPRKRKEKRAAKRKAGPKLKNPLRPRSHAHK
jgi:DNA-3-methyladenine glycosylase II